MLIFIFKIISLELNEVIKYLFPFIDIADNNSRVRSASAMRQPSAAKASTTPPQTATTQVQDAYSIRNIEEYVELLYEDLNEKIRGSSLILKIARNPDNLEELEKNGK